MKKVFIMMALIMAAALVNAQRTPVKVADLPKGISDYISKDYVGFTIKGATKVMANNEISYETIISKGNAQETLLFNKDGSFIRKVLAKEGSTERPKTSQMAHARMPAKPTAKK